MRTGYQHHLILCIVASGGGTARAMQKVQGEQVLSEQTPKPTHLYWAGGKVWNVTYELEVGDDNSADIVGAEIVERITPKLGEVGLEILDWTVRVYH